jgi:hypothetical protein
MALCCPPGHGCNAPGGSEPCALALCQAVAEEDDAALALARWGALEAASERNCGDGERRFRRRAFERARDRALIGLAMTPGPLAVTPGPWSARGAPIASAVKKASVRSRTRRPPRLAYPRT